MCYSFAPITWSFPWNNENQQLCDSPPEGNYTITYHFNIFDGVHEAKLSLFGVNYQFVGFYYCIKYSSYFKASADENSLQNNLASRIHLYVEGNTFFN